MNAAPARMVPVSAGLVAVPRGMDGFFGSLWLPERRLTAHADVFPIISTQSSHEWCTRLRRRRFLDFAPMDVEG
jgi:hypothetical protein